MRKRPGLPWGRKCDVVRRIAKAISQMRRAHRICEVAWNPSMSQMRQSHRKSKFAIANINRKCEIFYHGLKPSARNVIDAAAGGSVMGKTTEEALQLLNEIYENAIHWPSEHVKTQQSNQSKACDMCGGNHQNHECQATNQTDEQVNVIGYKPYTFGSPMAQKHPGCQWSNPNGAENSQSFQKQQVQGPPGYQNQNRGKPSYRPYQQAGPYQQARSYQQRPQQAHSSLDDLLYKYIKVPDEKMKSQNSSLKNLEIQLSQLAALVSEKIQGPLPSNTEKNPNEHLKAITLRSGKELDEPYAERQEKNQTEQQVDKGKNFEKPSEPSKEKEIKNKEEKISEKMAAPPVTIPFPQKIKREKLDGQFAKFLEILKQIHINIPFTDAFAILQNKLQQKLGDPGSFTIPCTLGGVYFEKALCDSGASINLMPFSIFRKLDLGEMKDIGVSLQFAD
ncbi:PREDICTED: uncharacterized protein LOC109227962 [Nicotiana attenuata]|uniref:uncharacterized protein LOC109227962 n=1 Tax=Nicotiana attenuata TaxID=49451 RepID=UPI000905BEC4|nr:PREDICTED: uncharacterized protein LOC109227962 [Nicotiana attenuata]